MSNEHLVPTQIVDVNGTITHRLKAPDKATPKTPRKKLDDKVKVPTKASGRKRDSEGYGTVQGTKNRNPLKMRDYQTDTVNKLIDELDKADRASAAAACGMGKTVMAQGLIRKHYDERQSDGIYIFITDGIRLTDQSREAFDVNAVLGAHEVFTVHSKSPDFAKARSRSGDRDIDAAEQAAIAEFLAKPSELPKVIFSTYDSADKIARAQQTLGGYEADLTVFDEAHRLSGEYDFKPKVKVNLEQVEETEGAEFAPNGRVPRVLFDEVPGSIQANKRVYLSATPSFQEEYDDSFALTKERKSKGTKVSKAWVYEVTSDKLRQRAEEEETGKVGKEIIHLDQMNTGVFGKTVASYDINYAIQHDMLTRVDRTAAVVKSRVPYDPSRGRPDFDTLKLDVNGAPSEGGMYAASYVAAAATMEALADGDGEAHNVLAFLPLNKSSEEFKQNWKSIATNIAGPDAPSLKDARQIVDNPEQHDDARVRQARIVMVSEYANVINVDAKMPQSVKDEGYAYFNDDKQVCDCGGKAAGKWCACARIVSNFDLFGQGIDIKQVDTVVQMNKNKISDAAITQSIGRAARLHKDKKSARVVVPILKFDTDDEMSSDSVINSEIANKTLNGWSRLGRNVTEAAFSRKQMAPNDPEPVRILGTRTGATTTGMNRQLSGNPTSTYIKYQAYREIRDGADSHYSKDASLDWKGMSPEQRQPYYESYATASPSPFAKMIVASKYPNYDRETANNAISNWEAIETRLRSHDRDSLSRTETRLLYGADKVSRDGKTVGKQPKGHVAPDPLWPLQFDAETSNAAMRDMGVPDELIQRYADVNGAPNRARLRAEEKGTLQY